MELQSLPNSSNDAPVFKDNQTDTVGRGTFVHGFSAYEKRDRKCSDNDQLISDDFRMAEEPKLFNPTIIQNN